MPTKEVAQQQHAWAQYERHSGSGDGEFSLSLFSCLLSCAGVRNFLLCGRWLEFAPRHLGAEHQPGRRSRRE